MSRYAYIVCSHHGAAGVFLSKKKAEEYVRKRNSNTYRPPIVYVDRVIRNEPDSHLACRFTASHFLGETVPSSKHHLPFTPETYDGY